MSGSRPSFRDELLERCILAFDAGDAAAAEALLVAHPEHAAELRTHLELLKSFGILHAPAASTPLPDRLGDFRLVRQLGRGGMGVVYLAEQIALQRQVALKLVHPEQLFFAGSRERFRREILAVARLQHPGIVPILTAGEAEGIPFYAMELVPGASLQELLLELAGNAPAMLDGRALRTALHRAAAKKHDFGRVDDAPVFAGAWVAVCCQLALQAATALQHAHEQGVLHRDIKPSNLLLTNAGKVRLIDFGLATARGEQRITCTGSAIGSLPYMAPEQVRGAIDAIDVRTDVYSLGVTLYELLTLTLPYGDGSGTTRERILGGACEPPTRRNPQIHPDVDAICLLAMDVDPLRRYPSASAFADDLRAFLEHRSVRARRPSLLLRARRWTVRHPGRAASAASAFLLCVPAPLAFALQQSKARAEIQVERDAADAQRKEAEHQRGLADTQRELAEANLGHALAAVDQMLFRTAQAKLAEVPRTKNLQRNLLEDAVRFYERLLASTANTTRQPFVAAQQARTAIRLAMLKYDLGDLGAARTLLRDAIATLQALQAEAGAEAAVALGVELTIARQQLADVLGRLDALAESEAEQRAAVDLLQALVAGHPARTDLQTRLHSARLSLGSALARLRRFDDANRLFDEVDAATADSAPHGTDANEELQRRIDHARAAESRGVTATLAGDTARAMAAFEQALQRLDALAASDRAEAGVLSTRLLVLERLGALANQRREWQRALAWLDQAAAELERLHEAEPELPDRAARLADNLGTRAAARRQLQDGQGALQDHDRAVGLLTDVVRRVPEDAEHRRKLAIALGERAGTHLAKGDAEAALADLDGAQRELESLLQASPGDENFKANLSAMLGNRARVLVQLGRTPEAREAIEQAIEIARTRRGGEVERSLIEQCSKAAELAMSVGDVEPAADWMAEASQRATAWLQQAPDDAVRQATAAMIAVNRGTMLLQLRRHDDARTIWEAALPTARAAAAQGPFGRQILALALLRLAELAVRDGDLASGRRWFAAARQETQVTRAQANGHAALQALFDRDDFQDLLPTQPGR
ncbi:MAG: protein kinase [Planctomycetes bacterium]|nr:protein kinase [Planctomycetota bacterium]